MGRVYDAKTGTEEPSGELPFPRPCRVEAIINRGGFAEYDDAGSVVGVTEPRWGTLSKVARVEFDGDTDEGPATVTVLVFTAGHPASAFLDPDRQYGAISRATFRCHCRVRAG